MPGIEFDVQLEKGLESCHIICIFDDKDETKLLNIEKILKEIGLDVILIAHQHKHFDKKDGGKRSLSNSVSDIYEFIKTGYVNALEYQRPAIQGMIINSLKKVNKNVATIIGSDCHKWEFYPQKDENNANKQYISKIKALPTFRGLMFALTSIETRFNRIENKNKDYIKSILCNGEYYELSNGVNAIIGDNGSGKTFLLDLVYENNLKSYYKTLKQVNGVEKILEGTPNIKYIKQNQIIDDVKKGNLFNTSNTEFYKEIKSKDTFKKRIKKYSEDVIKYIQKNISVNSQFESLKKQNILIKDDDTKNYVPIIKNDLNIGENLFEERITSLQEIVDNLIEEYEDNNKFYNKHSKNLKKIIKDLNKIIEDLKKKNQIITKETEIKNTIISAIDNFNRIMNNDRSDKEKEDLQYKKEKNEFCNAIINVIKEQKKERKKPIFPKAMSGNSKNLYKGFKFSKKTKYDCQFLQDSFFEDLFKKYYNIDNIFDIKTKEILVDCLLGITKYEDLSNWYKKVNIFIDKYLCEETYIEKKSDGIEMGNTPGEISIVFYDFTLNNPENEISVILIDQPEDDISNNKISKELISYVNAIRDQKQIIMVTHNPLMVVNLDVDNVLSINKDYKNNISIKSGCLEYENAELNDEYKIIDEIAQKMDG